MKHKELEKHGSGFVPAFTYAWMIPYLTRIGERHGYAMCFHGSMSRDVDCLAMPWVETANSPKELLDEILDITGGYVLKKEGDPLFTQKPHGRRAVTIHFNDAWHYLDLSIAPRVCPKQ